jgi:hypothetical protein
MAESVVHHRRAEQVRVIVAPAGIRGTGIIIRYVARDQPPVSGRDDVAALRE